MATTPVLVRALRPALALLVLALVVAHVGADPFVAALRHTSAPAVAVALVVTAVVTWCSARRWVLVAAALGLPLDRREAYAAYYRSQLLNVTLPGGVLGDVQRAWRHGSEVDARGPAARAVVWERAIGLVSLLTVGGVVVLATPWVLRDEAVAWVGGAVVAAAACGALLAARRGRGGDVGGVLRRDLGALRSSGALPPAIALSVAGVGGHLVVLLAALRAAGVDLPLTTALPLLTAVLLASTVPATVAGWGPREGAAAVVFGAAGAGSATGVTVAAVYGVLAMLATAPGLVVLVARPAPRQEVRA